MEFGIFVIGIFAVLCVPLIVSIFAPGPGPKLFALGWSVLAMLLSVEDYWWLVPWSIGLVAACWAVRQRSRSPKSL